MIILNALATVINMVCQIYFYIVVARALISWVNPDPYNPIVRFLHNVTDPVLDRIRRILPFNLGGIDISPIVLLFGLEVVRQLLLQLLGMIAQGLGGY
ncbi:MAG: YggT family protein [Desulfuromonas sp.]|nr:MAG: YggT family protein [Desulfuromonas sp.]